MEKRPTLLEEMTQPPLSKELGHRCRWAFLWGTLPISFAAGGIVAGKCLGENWLQPVVNAGMASGCALSIVLISGLIFKKLPGEVDAADIPDVATAKQQAGKAVLACLLVAAHSFAGMGLSTQLGLWGARKLATQPTKAEKTSPTSTGPQLVDPELAQPTPALR